MPDYDSSVPQVSGPPARETAKTEVEDLPGVILEALTEAEIGLTKHEILRAVEGKQGRVSVIDLFAVIEQMARPPGLLQTAWRPSTQQTVYLPGDAD